jgi:hypothetical protein
VEPILVKLPPENIVRLKFLIESYEGIGVVRTLEPDTGLVVILTMPDGAPTVLELLENLKGEIHCRVLPLPENADEDWLFS